MNICFYTSARPSITSLLNIGYLIDKRSAHNYSFINVAVKEERVTFKDRLKDIYVKTRFNDGRFDFQKDILTLQNNLKAHLRQINKKDFQNENVIEINDKLSEQFLNNVQADVIIQAGAGILKENIFTRAKIATINVHHGISPDIRGVESTFWCMFYGIREKIGVTCHVIDKGLDTGTVIFQSPLLTTANSYIDVQMENYLLGQDVLVNSIDILDRGDIKTVNKGQVKSYYFGIPDNFLYYALKKRNFNSLMKIEQKAYKMKGLNIIE